MVKRKICVVITARPSYSRIKTALIAIKNHAKLELQLVVAGSALLNRYGSSIDYIENDGFEIKEKVFMILEGDNATSMGKTTGLGIMELSSVFYRLQPDAVILDLDLGAGPTGLDLAIGFSHNIVLNVAPEVKVETISDKGKNPIVKLTSHDKQLVGQVAAKIRGFRKPEPYKGKGIRFVGEIIRRKAGKSA